jgi:dihydrofolate reductase
MPKVRVLSFSLSLDGFGAGPDQSLQNPLGVNGPEMFQWFMATRTWRKMQGLGDDGETGVGDRDVRIGGGAATIRQYLQAGLIDDLHLAMGPVLLGRGEPLFAGLDLRALGYECEKNIAGERTTHVLLRRAR